jgi:DNA-binding NarL/FixJ family response regulator
MEQIKILIVDDQKTMLDGLRAILETDKAINVIGMADNGKKALEMIEENKPDIVLLDIRMPVLNGIDCAKIIKKRWDFIKIIVLTTFNDEKYIEEVIKSNVNGYLLKDTSGEKLIQSVKDVFNDEFLLPTSVAAKIVGKVKNNNSYTDENLKNKLNLSDRENEIAIMISEGFTNKQIASSLYITTGTVKNYVSSLYNKLDVSDRTNALIKIKDLLQ